MEDDRTDVPSKIALVQVVAEGQIATGNVEGLRKSVAAGRDLVVLAGNDPETSISIDLCALHVALYERSFDRAVELSLDVVRRSEENALWGRAVFAHGMASMVYRAAGDLSSAWSHAERSAVCAARSGPGAWNTLQVEFAHAHAALGLERFRDAHTHLKRLAELNIVQHVDVCAAGLALAQAVSGQPDTAAVLLGALDSARGRRGGAVIGAPFEVQQVSNLIARAEALLGSGYELSRSHGALMNQAQLSEYIARLELPQAP
jgi:hypothetical protein